jgi:putative Mg2+ transporter-C (MgtC) family protein
VEDAYALSLIEVIERLALAVGIGAAIGLNRDLRDKPAGVRTHALVSLGAAVVTLTVLWLASESGTPTVDPASRAIQGIITGVGFIGGGVILQTSSGRVEGLTTAATIWIAACLGIVAGTGGWAVGAVGAVFTLLVLELGGPFEDIVRRLLGRGPSRD